jgi:hypothetical protein
MTFRLRDQSRLVMTNRKSLTLILLISASARNRTVPAGLTSPQPDAFESIPSFRSSDVCRPSESARSNLGICEARLITAFPSSVGDLLGGSLLRGCGDPHIRRLLVRCLVLHGGAIYERQDAT